MSTTSDTVMLTAHCLCKAHTFSTSIPTSKLPLEASACHCTSCRHSTGALYSIDVPWPAPRSSVNTSTLKTFHFSKKIILLFCGTCGTPIFWENPGDPDWGLGVFTGTLENSKEDLVKITSHIFVEDTRDGGATMWLRKPNADGSDAKRFKLRTDGEECPLDWPSPEGLTGFEAKKEDTLSVWCKCKGVNFELHRGDYTNTKKEDLPWFIDPRTHKNLIGFCACDSCRLASGMDILNWTFSEIKNISIPHSVSPSMPFPKSSTELKALVDAKDPRFGTLTYFASSHDVQRYFCSTCSATIFYAVNDRPTMINIAIGVLDASDGARAEGFLSWAFGAVGHRGKQADTGDNWREGFVQRIEHESENWRKKRGYPKNWRREEREKAEARGEEYC